MTVTIIKSAEQAAVEAAVALSERRAAERQTGIRRSNSGAWCAIVEGRLIDSWVGAGAKATAIRVAGTNRVIA
jgi:hypothetical protein